MLVTWWLQDVCLVVTWHLTWLLRGGNTVVTGLATATFSDALKYSISSSTMQPTIFFFFFGL